MYKEDKKSVTTFGRRGCFLYVHIEQFENEPQWRHGD